MHPLPTHAPVLGEQVDRLFSANFRMALDLTPEKNGNRRRHSTRFYRSMAHFDPPAIQDNPNGWGPCSVPEKFKDMPYQPFSKGDRLGKVLVSY